MLLLHQTGSVKIGEIVRYTVTYTPAYDRIIPSPSHLHLKIKNTSAIALRAAFVHGPYTLYAAAYPANFQPNEKLENPRRDGVPEFEPNLKAGGTFVTKLAVPEEVRATAGTADKYSPGRESAETKSVSWIIEVTSQVVFSNSAAVHYEILLGRDQNSLSLGFGSSITGGNSGTNPVPGQVSDHQQSKHAKDGKHAAQPKGVYSKAISLRVDDTASLWNTPRMPQWDDVEEKLGHKVGADEPVMKAMEGKGSDKEKEQQRQRKQKKVHLVVLTHGLHSNLGADMLYLKESIDATAKQARIDARARRKRERGMWPKPGQSPEESEDYKKRGLKDPSPLVGVTGEESESDDEEEVVVRGFSGNAVRTERGIKYLGKRLAKYVLAMTYPDQPYKPVTKKSATMALSHAMKPDPQAKQPTNPGTPSHHDSTIVKAPYHDKKLAYKITSISFIAHSLGGLTQTYAVAYIQKHSPQFFDLIKPINFIALASPFLGLSNENPLYVKFALDFGLVGRSGQDLGLTWRAPTIARSGWGAIVGNIGESAHKKIDGEVAPESKPLLRILPTGPAHIVLKKFRNRTVYSNVVNDGIVPLRTSCLLFLDWSGLGRVEKARRENGLVGTMAGWGWAEITGANSSSPSRKLYSGDASDAEEIPVSTGLNTPTREGHGEDVPQPHPSATHDDDTRSLKGADSKPHSGGNELQPADSNPAVRNNDGPLASLIKLFQPNTSAKAQNHEPRQAKIYKRSQTLKIGSGSDVSTSNVSTQEGSSKNTRTKATNGDENEDFERHAAPPKTTFFESAGDLLKPPLPSVEFLINPQSRPRTIFHDRVYHPEDIPPPPLKRRHSMVQKRRSRSGLHSPSSDGPIPSVRKADSNLSSKDYDDIRNQPDRDPGDVVDGSAMKVEEKIARAYHRDLSWRKVLVRLEPDAHNNMIVRRMFANAYGWPVVKHLCDTHFADSPEANTRDDEEGTQDNAKQAHENVGRHGEETTQSEAHKQDHKHALTLQDRTDSEVREASDVVPSLDPNPHPGSLGRALGLHSSPRKPSYERSESEAWSERDWADSGDDSDDVDDTHVDGKKPFSDSKKGNWNWTEAIAGRGAAVTSPTGTDKDELDKFFGKKKSNKEANPEQDDPEAMQISSGELAGIGVGLGGLSLDTKGAAGDVPNR